MARITNGFMTIGQVAGAVGVPISTLRFYERQGLMHWTQRSDAGYRLYDPAAVERLRFIRGGQAVGFTLEDIRTLLEQYPLAQTTTAGVGPLETL